MLIKKFNHITDYEKVFALMKAEVDLTSMENQIWILEHHPVFTQGRNGKKENILKTTNIPVIQADRGGQITYHGPGQIIYYLLFDLINLKIKIIELVNIIEHTIIEALAQLKLKAHIINKQHGVYINGAKIASIGLRLNRKGRTYHGFSFNFNMDLTPFNYINPCGYKGLKTINLNDLCSDINKSNFTDRIVKLLCKNIESFNIKEKEVLND